MPSFGFSCSVCLWSLLCFLNFDNHLVSEVCFQHTKQIWGRILYIVFVLVKEVKPFIFIETNGVWYYLNHLILIFLVNFFSYLHVFSFLFGY